MFGAVNVTSFTKNNTMVSLECSRSQSIVLMRNKKRKNFVSNCW